MTRGNPAAAPGFPLAANFRQARLPLSPGLLVTCLLLAGCFGPRERLPGLAAFAELPATSAAAGMVPAAASRPTPDVTPVGYVAAPPAQALRRLAHITDLTQLGEEQFRGLHLATAVRHALEKNVIIKDDRQFLSPSNAFLASPETSPSTLDSLIQESSDGGVEAAESAFDLQAAAGAQWGENSLIQSNGFLNGNTSQSDILVSDAGSIFARLDKPMGTGGTLSLVHNWNYTFNNLPSLSASPRYAGFLRGEFRQPLWAGSGEEFTAVFGPLNSRTGRLGRGMVVARIDQNLSLADFEARLHTLLKQTMDLYWDLWLGYRRHRTQVAARDSAYQLWQHIRGRAEAGLPGGEAADEAQAAENFFRRQELAETSLAEALDAERRLRRLIGLPAAEGRLLWPRDEPDRRHHTFAWQPALTEALHQRIELRQQKLRVESLELQARAAGNLLRPQLDFVSGVQVNGLGDSLYSGTTTPSAYDSLLDADDVGWNAGFEMSLPFGFRLEKARIRNLELQLSKARAVHDALETEISLELDAALRDLDRWHATLESSRQRYEAALRQLRAVEADYQAGRASVDRLVRSQITVAEAELSRAGSEAAYNKALTNVLYRQGALLAHHHIIVEQPAAEAPLPGPPR
ncbi:MAG: hypothetical protein DWQ35_12215 [Planctomycetota bacterium]|nr:MAG: hypothetical protein DWQ35_12215 [Planctomycetota bacterium]REK44208.1 MAG: hypothetical protein DWQ46_10495 [Planctomycetota bacterium]